ncbi:MAG TPA: hypothetical protein VHF28_07295 [Nitrososphaera sp.]|nr:hypothetical protein [Nitrososphaera sp.]
MRDPINILIIDNARMVIAIVKGIPQQAAQNENTILVYSPS